MANKPLALTAVKYVTNLLQLVYIEIASPECMKFVLYKDTLQCTYVILQETTANQKRK